MRAKKVVRKVVPHRLALVRQELNWTQGQMAYQINENLDTNKRITAVTVSNWETGRRRCPDKYVPIITKIGNVDASFLYGDDIVAELPEEEDLTIVTAETLSKYDRQPLYVEFLDYQHENGWCLYSKELNKLIFTDRVMTLYPKYITSNSIKLYSKQPLYSINEDVNYTKKCDLYSVMKADMVYVVVNNMDPVIRAKYNGWYQHNATHTALQNSTGHILPYEGLGISYMAYNATKNI